MKVIFWDLAIAEKKVSLSMSSLMLFFICRQHKKNQKKKKNWLFVYLLKGDWNIVASRKGKVSKSNTLTYKSKIFCQINTCFFGIDMPNKHLLRGPLILLIEKRSG